LAQKAGAAAILFSRRAVSLAIGVRQHESDGIEGCDSVEHVF
jgi:hypothetical protein